MKFFHLVWSNLKRKKLRTALTLLSIVVAFVLFGFLSSIKQALVGGVQVAGVNRLVVRHKVSIIQLLPESYKARMLRVPGVSAATHLTWFGGYYQEKKNWFPQMPVVPEEFLDLHPEFLLTPAEKDAWQKTRTGAIVGRKTAEKYHFKVGDKLPIFSPIWTRAGSDHNWEFDIVGIFEGAKKATDTTTVYFRQDYFEESKQFAKGQVGWYVVRVNDPARAPEIAAALDKEFENSPAETKAEPEGAFAQGFANQMGNIALIVAGIMAAVFFIILLVTGNTMAQAVRERTGELGVLKAIGFTNGQVLFLVVAESCLLAIMGGLIGIGLSALLTAGGDPTGGYLPMFYFPRNDAIVGIGIAVALGLATGFLPGIMAMRLQVANALRRM